MSPRTFLISHLKSCHEEKSRPRNFYFSFFIFIAKKVNANNQVILNNRMHTLCPLILQRQHHSKAKKITTTKKKYRAICILNINASICSKIVGNKSKRYKRV